MFVHIKRGDNKLFVPYKAFINKFKPIGYTMYDPAHEIDVNADIDLQQETSDGITPNTGMPLVQDDAETDPEENTDDTDSGLSEIPLSEMTFQQLQEYAKEIGLSANGYTSKKMLREAIAQHLRK